MATKNNQGFSLVEVLVSISIIVMIISTVLYNYGGFNDRLAISAGAQEIAIAVRQAQTYGLTVKEVAVGGGSFSSAYGVYFDYNSTPTNYYIFADTNNNHKYDVGSGCGSGSTECIEKFTLRNGVTITSVCNETACAPTGALSTVRMMDVTFLRPNPDATIYFTTAAGADVITNALTGKVVLTSNKGNTVTVTIESTGQVSVQ